MGLFFLAAGCGESGTAPDQPDNTANDSTYCNCNELVFDEPYNHFYLTEKRKGFTGKCEDFYPDGQKKTEKNFLEGKLHGKVITWYKNGQVHEEKQFDMNFQTGEQITYTDKGEVKFHALYKRGNQTEVLVSRPELPETDEWSPN